VELTSVGTVLVDVTFGVGIERHEQALEISVARNLLNIEGIEKEALFGIALLSGGPAVIVTDVVTVAGSTSLSVHQYGLLK
jgi:hypothetical protein